MTGNEISVSLEECGAINVYSLISALFRAKVQSGAIDFGSNEGGSMMRRD
jgi:hypothetical protein